MHLTTLLSVPLSAANSAKSFIGAVYNTVNDPNRSNSTLSSFSGCIFLKKKKNVYKKDILECLKYGWMVRS